MGFLSSERAVTEVVGQVIILGLTVVGISFITLFSSPMIYDMQDMANTKSAEQTFNLFDSFASQSVLGDIPIQIIDINLGGGSLIVEPNSTLSKSYISIKLGEEGEVINIPMGKVIYKVGDRTVAYEGGGVWSKHNLEGSAIISPPKFNYNSVTLTLPVISITGNSSESGKGISSVRFKKNTTRVLYPDENLANMTNPISSSETIYINITSDFYDAWTEYVRTLGYTEVTADPATRTASVKLSIVPDSKNSPITDPITFRGLNSSTPMLNFSLKLVPYGDKVDWDMHAFSGTKRLVFHIKGDSSKPGDEADINIGYQDEGSGYSKPAETWAGHEKLTLKEQGGTMYFDADLLSRDINLTYTSKDIGAGNKYITSGSFNTSSFSWPDSSSTIQISTRYKWSFEADSESWTSGYTGNTAILGFNETAGNMPGSIYSKLTGSSTSKTSTTVWTSPDFPWISGAPASARLDFDWRVATYTKANPGNFYVLLVKPNGSTSRIFQTSVFNNSTSGWTGKSNSSISVNDFSQPGIYRLKLISTLNTSGWYGFPSPAVEVGWDNPAITLNSTFTVGSQLTSKSLYDITSHYFGEMVQNGGISLHQGLVPGKMPAAESAMLVDYNPAEAPIYLYISQNTVDVSIES